MAAPPKLADWVKQLGDSTPGITVKRMTGEQRQAAYQQFLAEFRRTGDFVLASNNAAQGVQAQVGQQARAQAAKPAAPAGSPTTPSTAPPKTAADAASQAAQNPQAAALTQGPFSGQTATANSLFGSGGIDPTTPIPGKVGGGPISSNGEQLSGRGSFSDPSQIPTPGGQHIPAVTGGGSYQQPETTQTADQWLQGLYKMDPKDLARLQQQLYGAGWYDPTNVPTANLIPYGKVDPATIAAYEQAMIETARYNAAGKHLLLDDVIAQGAPRVPGLGKKAPKQPSQSFANPVDLRNQAQQSADSLTGQNMSADQAQQFADYYQAQEKASYAQYAQAGQDRAVGLGGSYTGPPSQQAAAEAFIRQTDPTAVQAYGMASRSQEFLNLLGSATGR